MLVFAIMDPDEDNASQHTDLRDKHWGTQAQRLPDLEHEGRECSSPRVIDVGLHAVLDMGQGRVASQHPGDGPQRSR